MKRSALLIVSLALVAVACGESDAGSQPTAPPVTSSPATTTRTPATTTPDPTPGDPDERILVVHRGGGLVPPEFLLDRLPLYTLYADGRLVYEGARPAIFPGPLLPRLIRVDIGAEGMADVLAAVDAIGLPDITELHNNDAINQVADGPQTEVSYFDESGEHFFSVYSLQIADHTNEQVLKLRDLMTLLDRLTATSPDGSPFPVERLQVIVSAQTANTDDPLAVVEPWPLSMPPGQMTEYDFALRCGVVNVAEEPGVLETFEAAHQMTFFESDGVAHRLTVRPLLTGEEGCEPRDR
jgi:hypothetical protein